MTKVNKPPNVPVISNLEDSGAAFLEGEAVGEDAEIVAVELRLPLAAVEDVEADLI
jgi:hypothetical protein